ncbi:FAD-dependent oxidoreductase [Mesorhizobium silamurunense]|uniref:FAD-dependent oxidoreductase n=1 Tax=Mesorhizobium silamurunense TaxID=499528 RepID=UPI001FEDECDF|nr:FAD-dependent oxidoreductase [Mesorhizobium silamurunense]
MEDVDVVIIGAGSAGLSAAKTLRAAGLSFTLLEAMSRIGGRAWTSDRHFGMPFDIGCAWLHAADRNWGASALCAAPMRRPVPAVPKRAPR